MAWLDTILTYFTLHPAHLFILLLVIAWGKSTVLISSLLPPASILLLTGITISQEKLHLGLVWLAITTGAVTGSILNYHIGYVMAYTPWIKHLTAKHFNRMIYVQNLLQKNTVVMLFSARFLAILRYIVPLVAGMIKVGAIKVYLINLLSAAIWAVLHIWVVTTIYTL